MKAYVALLTVPNTITCHEEVAVLTKQPVRKRYEEEDEKEDEPLEIEYEDEALDVEYEGGGKDRDLVVNNPNFTIYRMEKSNHSYDGYTRDCPLTRRPIALLTEDEVKRANKFPQYVYDKVPYICPMYWDLEEKTPLTQEEVDVLVRQGKRILFLVH